MGGGEIRKGRAKKKKKKKEKYVERGGVVKSMEGATQYVVSASLHMTRFKWILCLTSSVLFTNGNLALERWTILSGILVTYFKGMNRKHLLFFATFDWYTTKWTVEIVTTKRAD